MDTKIALQGEDITGRGRTVNPFLILDGAADFIRFAEQVFGAAENREVRTPTPSGALIHAEIALGDSLVLLSDPQPGWPLRPGLLQIWIADLDGVMSRAEQRGGRVITPPTPFYGEITLARLEDPWQNLWWLYQPTPGQPDPLPVWEGGSDVVFRTLDEHLRVSG
ncbi:VOC family protein [Microbacterium sp. NPDC057650]|uniref:VOC family protein n=1 Tax=unclassified Microbacterium TaxID=2609290 RepID=UPI003671393E